MKKVTKREREITLGDLVKLISGVSVDLDNLAVSTAKGFAKSEDNLTKAIEALATSTARGFEDAEEERKKHQAKEEKRFEAIDNSLKDVFDQLSIIRSEVRDTKGTLGPLARAVKMQNEELTDLHLRVGVLERKMGVFKK